MTRQSPWTAIDYPRSDESVHCGDGRRTPRDVLTFLACPDVDVADLLTVTRNPLVGDVPGEVLSHCQDVVADATRARLVGIAHGTVQGSRVSRKRDLNREAVQSGTEADIFQRP